MLYLQNKAETATFRKGIEMENIDISEVNILRDRIGALRMSLTSFAELMGLSRSTARKKLDGEIQFKAKEIIRACEVLQIPYEEAHLYFFDSFVAKMDTNKDK